MKKVIYYIVVKNLLNQRVHYKEVEADSLSEVLALIATILLQRKYTDYHKAGLVISMHQKLQGQLCNSGKAYHKECFQNLCIHYKLTVTEVVYLRLMKLGISRKNMIAAIFRLLKTVVT